MISRLTTTARNTLGTALTNAEDGMLVYDKDLTTFFYWDGPNLQWVQVGSGTGDNWGTQVVQTTGANITGDGTTANPIAVTDNDSDPTNEHNTGVNLTGNNLNIIDGGSTQTVDLSNLKDHDWYEVGGTTQADAITDNIYTQGNVGIGSASPTNKLDINGDLRIRTLNSGSSSDKALVTDATGVVKQVEPYVPPGGVMPFAMLSPPNGWLSCDGSTVSRTTYANLFAAIGTTYGAGDGTTTFNLPDLRGVFVRGLNTSSSGYAANGSIGNLHQGTTIPFMGLYAGTSNTVMYSGFGPSGISSYPATNYPEDFEMHPSYPTSTTGTGYYLTYLNTVGGVGSVGNSSHSRGYRFIPQPQNVSMNYCIKY